MTCLCEVSSSHWERQGEEEYVLLGIIKKVCKREFILHKRGLSLGALKLPIHCIFFE